MGFFSQASSAPRRAASNTATPAEDEDHIAIKDEVFRIIIFYVESVEEVSVVEESVGEEKVEEHDEQVENFAEDEPAEIYVVPQNKQ